METGKRMLGKIIKIGIPVVVIAFFGWLLFGPALRVGYSPEQPIPYDHELHAGQYNIDCQYCHTGVTKGKKATVPSLNICMNCHSVVGSDKPNVEKLVNAYSENKTIEWIRVHNMPDHVQFSHAPHIKALWDGKSPSKEVCATCHGDVASMERVAQVKALNMGFCVNCHRENRDKGAKTNCSTCHY